MLERTINKNGQSRDMGKTKNEDKRDKNTTQTTKMTVPEGQAVPVSYKTPSDVLLSQDRSNYSW